VVGYTAADEIGTGVGRLTAWLEQVDPALLYLAPVAGEWTVMELLAHTAEFLRYWPPIMVSIAEKPGQPFGRGLEDTERTGYVRAHAGDPLERMVTALNDAAGDAVATLGTIPPAGWDATGVHATWGELALPEIVQRVLTGHLTGHIAQAQTTYDLACSTRAKEETPVAMDPNDMNTAIINEFRSNAGAVGGYFEGKPVLLLHHTGAKTGTARVNPLMYRREGDAYAIFASKAGAPTNPDWFSNLKANPDASIEVGPDTIDVTAAVAGPEERDVIYARQAEEYPQFAEYAQNTTRTIPVVLLTPKG
jgi:deazaflavin-dependent oxidoreductase (nitroreductase family)